MQATKPSATERPGSETSRLVIESTCVVCLQPCEGKKACACSFMHQQCAEAYKQTYGACKVCSVDFTQSIARLNKRHVDAEDEMEMEKRARQRRCAYEEAEKMKNLEWARCVAPSAAHILYRHFRHTGNEAGQTELSFGTIVLSLIHSGEQYIEDLAERLAESKPRPVVDEAIRRLQSLGETLVSPEGIDEACSEEFMRHFQATLAERTNAPFRWNEM